MSDRDPGYDDSFDWQQMGAPGGGYPRRVKQRKVPEQRNPPAARQANYRNSRSGYRYVGDNRDPQGRDYNGAYNGFWGQLGGPGLSREGGGPRTETLSKPYRAPPVGRPDMGSAPVGHAFHAGDQPSFGDGPVRRRRR